MLKLIQKLLIFLMLLMASSIFSETIVPDIKIKFNNSSEEMDRIIYTIKRMQFYRKYNYHPVLPRDAIINSLIDKSLNNKLKDDDFKEFYCFQ